MKLSFYKQRGVQEIQIWDIENDEHVGGIKINHSFDKKKTTKLMAHLRKLNINS